MDGDDGMITNISKTEGGSVEDKQEFTQIKFTYSENETTKSRVQDIFLENQITKERSKLVLTQECDGYKYLEEYNPLKSYINQSAYPNFRIGAGITVSDFVKKELVYDIARTNFNQVTAGNAMKYSSCVRDDGTMDFSQVKKFVETAKQGGVAIYGHTLCWHAQQNNTYLNGLIEDNVNAGGFVVKSDFEDGKSWGGWGNNSTRKVVDGEGSNKTKVMEVMNPSETNSWSAQVAYDFTEALTKDETYVLKMKIKGSVGGSIGAGFQNPDGYAGCGDFPAIAVKTEWSEVEVETKVTGEGAKRFLFNVGKYAGTLWMDDIEIYYGDPGSTPLTPEEKAQILTQALDDWIKGMMDACGGYVKLWDAVNEPMSDGNPFELKSAATESNAAQNFYWQDYLGKDFARVVVKLARKYGPSDLKLFINDYNLEAAYNDNKKCEGIIKMVEYWESDGVTKIDGIGTQMHVTCSMDPEEQQRNEDAIVRMFNLLSATGKLINITELDMGLKLAGSSENVKTTDMNEERHKAMAEFYKFIVSKYLEIIPPSQQYGITQWCTTDSPEDSYWCKGQPVGLWDLDYNKKHTYAGFADGLSGVQNEE